MARKRRCGGSASTSAAPPPKRVASSTVLELPQEVILDILLRLPAKSLFRFRCVGKPLDSFFYDPHFLKQHYSNSLHRRKLMMKITDRHILHTFGVPALCRGESGAEGQRRLRLPVSGFRRSIVGCCNGVVCLMVYRKGYAIYFWNPLTNQCIKLPYTFSNVYEKTRNHQNMFGFGFDDSTNEFKLVRIFVDYSSKPPKRAVEVYGMWEGSRKRISDFPYQRPHHSRPWTSYSGVCVNGALHWVASIPTSSRVIVALDMAKETFRPVLSLPDPLDNWAHDDIKLYCVGELLCFMHSYRHGEEHDVWIMKEYGVKESWVKLFAIPYQRAPLMSRPPSLPLYYSEINGELLMLYRGQLILYHSSSTDHSIQHLGINPSSKLGFDAEMCSTYVESLFTPSVLKGLRGESSHERTRLMIDGDIDRNAGVTTWCRRLRQTRNTV